MAHMPSPIRTTVAVLEIAPDAAPITCPMCHTPDLVVTQAALMAGGEWRCGRCGHRWDAEGLAAVAAYAEWCAGRERRREESQ
jgi:predicted Zn finger-like uncharacterized protein